MNPEELRDIMAYVRDRVRLDTREAGGPLTIRFDAPTAEEMIAAGLNAEGARRIRQVSWWDEMVTDIVETPEMCGPSDPPQQVLEYAKDVVSEYIRKRFPLHG